MPPKRKRDDGDASGSKSSFVPISRKSLEPCVKRCDFTKNKSYEPNIVRVLSKFKSGVKSRECLRWTADKCVLARLKEFRCFKMDPIKFFRRITAVKWHPKKYNLVALGSKCGEVILQNINELNNVKYTPLRTERHQAITNFCFDPFKDESLLMSSVDGTVSHWNYGKDIMDLVLDLNDGYVTWYNSVNASETTGLVVAGDSVGSLTLMSKDLKPFASHKIHKGKVNTAEFCKSQGNILATASLDKSVKIWDIRMIGKEIDKKGLAVPLEMVEHEYPINSAYFSKTDSARLLLTDQRMELKVYNMPFLTLESTIYHPHRQFQHLTPIKASWHPLADLIVVGRYPDPTWPDFDSEQRSVDIFDPRTGECHLHLTSKSLNIIMSLNEFNITGDCMASGMGMYVGYWKAEKVTDSIQGGKKGDSDSDNDSDDDQPKRPNYPSTSTKKTKGKDADSGKKKETKTKEKSDTRTTSKTKPPKRQNKKS